MKKSVLVLATLIITIAPIYSQKMIDAVYLKDGSIIKGKIIESGQEVIKIETCCGSIFVYKLNEVEKTEQVPEFKERHTIKEKGYVNYTSFGVLVGSSSNSETAPFSLITEHGYRFNKWFSINGLMGYELLNESTMPLALNVKGYYPVQNTNIFLGISGGYSFSLEEPTEFVVYYDNFSGGPMFNTELGIIIPFSEIGGFFMALGFRYNKMNYERYDYWIGDVDGVVHYKRLSVRVGISFY